MYLIAPSLFTWLILAHDRAFTIARSSRQEDNTMLTCIVLNLQGLSQSIGILRLWLVCGWWIHQLKKKKNKTKKSMKNDIKFAKRCPLGLRLDLGAGSASDSKPRKVSVKVGLGTFFSHSPLCWWLAGGKLSKAGGGEPVLYWYLFLVKTLSFKCYWLWVFFSVVEPS